VDFWKNQTHVFVAAVVILLVVVSVVVYSKDSSSQAQNTNTNVNVTNDPPTISVTARSSNIDGVWSPGDTLTPSAGTKNQITVNADITDTNGFNNQTITVEAVANRTQNSGTLSFFTCTGNDHTCLPRLQTANCSQLSGGAQTRAFRCTVGVEYNSDPTAAGTQIDPSTNKTAERWDFIIRVNDTFVDVDDKTSFFEYDELVSISLLSSVADLGTTPNDGSETPDNSGSGKGIALQNRGNTQLNWMTQVDKVNDGGIGGAWACTGTGNPLISDFRWSLNALDPYASMTGFTNSNEFSNIEANAQRDLDGGTFVPRIWTRFATTQELTTGSCSLSSLIITAVRDENP